MKLPDPKHFLFLFTGEGYLSLNDKKVIEMMKVYGRQIRDATLQWAAENATLDMCEDVDVEEVGKYVLREYMDYFEVDKGSILSGKTELEI